MCVSDYLANTMGFGVVCRESWPHHYGGVISHVDSGVEMNSKYHVVWTAICDLAGVRHLKAPNSTFLYSEGGVKKLWDKKDAVSIDRATLLYVARNSTPATVFCITTAEASALRDTVDRSCDNVKNKMLVHMLADLSKFQFPVFLVSRPEKRISTSASLLIRAWEDVYDALLYYPTLCKHMVRSFGWCGCVSCNTVCFWCQVAMFLTH